MTTAADIADLNSLFAEEGSEVALDTDIESVDGANLDDRTRLIPGGVRREFGTQMVENTSTLDGEYQNDEVDVARLNGESIWVGQKATNDEELEEELEVDDEGDGFDPADEGAAYERKVEPIDVDAIEASVEEEEALEEVSVDLGVDPDDLEDEASVDLGVDPDDIGLDEEVSVDLGVDPDDLEDEASVDLGANPDDIGLDEEVSVDLGVDDDSAASVDLDVDLEDLEEEAVEELVPVKKAVPSRVPKTAPTTKTRVPKAAELIDDDIFDDSEEDESEDVPVKSSRLSGAKARPSRATPAIKSNARPRPGRSAPATKASPSKRAALTKAAPATKAPPSKRAALTKAAPAIKASPSKRPSPAKATPATKAKAARPPAKATPAIKSKAARPPAKATSALSSASTRSKRPAPTRPAIKSSPSKQAEDELDDDVFDLESENDDEKDYRLGMLYVDGKPVYIDGAKDVDGNPLAKRLGRHNGRTTYMWVDGDDNEIYYYLEKDGTQVKISAPRSVRAKNSDSRNPLNRAVSLVSKDSTILPLEAMMMIDRDETLLEFRDRINLLRRIDDLELKPLLTGMSMVVLANKITNMAKYRYGYEDTQVERFIVDQLRA